MGEGKELVHDVCDCLYIRGKLSICDCSILVKPPSKVVLLDTAFYPWLNRKLSSSSKCEAFDLPNLRLVHSLCIHK